MVVLLFRTPFLSQFTLPDWRSGVSLRTRATISVGEDPVTFMRYDQDEPKPRLNCACVALESREARITVLGLEAGDRRLPDSHTGGDGTL
jgi:hypothetical protein